MVRVRSFLTTGIMALALVGVTGLLSGCQTGPEPSVRSTVAPGLATAEVGDVAVTTPTSGGDLAGPLRAALYQGLIARRFAVLNPDFVDQGGRGGAMLLTSIAAGPQVIGARTALYDATGEMLYDASVAASAGETDVVALAELLLRDLPSQGPDDPGPAPPEE